jgi:protein TonB
MSQVSGPEVFTPGELAQAVGVPLASVADLIASGHLPLISGTAFISAVDAVAAGRRLRLANTFHLPPKPALFDEPSVQDRRRAGVPVLVSSIVHASLIALAVVLTTMDANTAPTEERVHEPTHLVFLAIPGPGGGGGGGGLRQQAPPPNVERKGPTRDQISVPLATPRPAVTSRRDIAPPKNPTPAAPPLEPVPAPKEPDPLPSNILVAPVVAAATSSRDRDGLIERGQGDADSHGPGNGGGTGTGRGNGSGEGDGSGIGPGWGGGTGGGPYRPGSGIEPPRLVREVKADYSEEGRRRGISGDVLLEIVVRSDGTVGDVRVLKSLGAGLDQRAEQAVRQWRFEPARRKGAPVDVLVEVAVEFMLR